jgi:hypothetical protein
MSEVDIWLKVMDELGFFFIEEKTQPGDINMIEYLWMPTNHTYRLYFNRKTEQVNYLFCVVGAVDKHSFYKHYINLFRQIKLN